MSQEQTLGQKRVRAAFNPSENDIVDQIKKQAADLIDLVNSLPVKQGPSEKARLIAIASTSIEEAAMWATKAATTTEENETTK